MGEAVIGLATYSPSGCIAEHSRSPAERFSVRKFVGARESGSSHVRCGSSTLGRRAANGSGSPRSATTGHMQASVFPSQRWRRSRSRAPVRLSSSATFSARARPTTPRRRHRRASAALRTNRRRGVRQLRRRCSRTEFGTRPEERLPEPPTAAQQRHTLRRFQQGAQRRRSQHADENTLRPSSPQAPSPQASFVNTRPSKRRVALLSS